MKLPTSKHDQQVLLFTILGAGGICYVYFAYLSMPLLNQINRLGKEIQQTRAQLQLTEQLIAQEPQMRQEHDRLMHKLGDARSLLPPPEAMPTVIELLSDLASQAGLKIRTIFPQRTFEALGLVGATGTKPEEAAPPTRYKPMPIQIDAVAGFHQLGTFLSRMEAQPHPMELKTLRISIDDKDPYRHNMKIVVTGYFSAQSQASEEGNVGVRHGGS